MYDSTSNLAHNLRYLRKAKGLSQSDLAEVLGVNRSNIASYESKNVEPRLTLIIDIANYFNVSIRTLIENRLEEDGTDIPRNSTHNNRADELNETENTTELDLEFINAFVRKSQRVQKILDGFKAFYTYKKSTLKSIPKAQQQLIYNIDNFIQLLEHMLGYNKVIMEKLKSLQNQANS